MTLALLLGACGPAPAPAEPAEDRAALGATPACPAGNGLFILHYGDPFLPEVRDARPNFVVVGDLLHDDAAVPAFYHAAGVRVLAYVPTAYGRGHQEGCDNRPCSWDGQCIPVETRIVAALQAGYDGMFFDEVEPAAMAYNAACSALVKAGDAGKLVIMNPGMAEVPLELFDHADVVSVENDYQAPLPHAGQVAPWRWLAVQGDAGGGTDAGPQSLDDALARLQRFRQNGGFWYYSQSPHIRPDPWLAELAQAVRQLEGVACPAQATVRTQTLDQGNAHPGGR